MHRLMFIVLTALILLSHTNSEASNIIYTGSINTRNSMQRVNNYCRNICKPPLYRYSGRTKIVKDNTKKRVNAFKPMDRYIRKCGCIPLKPIEYRGYIFANAGQPSIDKFCRGACRAPTYKYSGKTKNMTVGNRAARGCGCFKLSGTVKQTTGIAVPRIKPSSIRSRPVGVKAGFLGRRGHPEQYCPKVCATRELMWNGNFRTSVLAHNRAAFPNRNSGRTCMCVPAGSGTYLSDRELQKVRMLKLKLEHWAKYNQPRRFNQQDNKLIQKIQKRMQERKPLSSEEQLLMMKLRDSNMQPGISPFGGPNTPSAPPPANDDRAYKEQLRLRRLRQGQAVSGLSAVPVSNPFGGPNLPPAGFNPAPPPATGDRAMKDALAQRRQRQAQASRFNAPPPSPFGGPNLPPSAIGNPFSGPSNPPYPPGGVGQAAPIGMPQANPFGGGAAVQAKPSRPGISLPAGSTARIMMNNPQFREFAAKQGYRF